MNPKAVRSLFFLLSPAILWGIHLVPTAPVDFSRLPSPYAPSGATFPPAAWDSPRGWTFPFNLLGTGLMLGVALYSTLRFWRENPLRARGTLVIALAVLVLAGTGSLNRLGAEELGRSCGSFEDVGSYDPLLLQSGDAWTPLHQGGQRLL